MTGLRTTTRSYLYTPADNDRRLAGAFTHAPDAVIADLEDSVALSAKGQARVNVRDWIQRGQAGDGERWVRVNAHVVGLDDIAAVFTPGVFGFCLPKVSSASELVRVDELLDSLEARFHLPSQSIWLMPLIESAAALVALDEIARAPRVLKLQLGELDLAADLGIQPDINETELSPLRMQVVVSSVAAGIVAPVGAVSSNFTDDEAFRVTTERLKRSGFVGRAAIHPNQLPSIHRTFAATAEEVAIARSRIQLYESSLAAGTGAVRSSDGHMIDEAVVRSSRRILAQFESERGQENR